MPKTYLRYAPSSVFGVVTSPTAPFAVDVSGQLVLTPQLESVGVWHARRGVQLATLSGAGAGAGAGAGPASEVTCLSVCPRGAVVAAGHADGGVVLWDYLREARVAVLRGHRRAVAALAWRADGAYLASGSRDTHAVLWDVLAEAGVARFKGHADEVTGVAFLACARSSGGGSGGSSSSSKSQYLLTCSKDALIKVWDLSSRACVQTVLGVRAELWGLWVSPERCVARAAHARARIFFARRARRLIFRPTRLLLLAQRPRHGRVVGLARARVGRGRAARGGK